MNERLIYSGAEFVLSAIGMVIAIAALGIPPTFDTFWRLTSCVFVMASVFCFVLGCLILRDK